MTTQELIDKGYIVFDKKMRFWCPTHKGFNVAMEGTEWFDDNILVGICRKLNDEVDVIY